MAGVEKGRKSSSTLLSVPFHNSLFILLIVSVLLLFNNGISKGTQSSKGSRAGEGPKSASFFRNSIQEEGKKLCKSWENAYWNLDLNTN